MERPSGLGRSLEDVLDSLTPVDADPSAAGRVLFEAEDLEQQLDSLMGEIRELRDRVQHLVALVPGDALKAYELDRDPNDGKKSKHKKSTAKHGKGKKHSGKKIKKLGKAGKAKGAKPRTHREAA
jgi:hypothetical protein